MDNLYKNILITGASSGIGEGLAIFYAQNGAENLFICGRNKERLKIVAEKCKKYCKNVFEEVLDVTDKKKTFAWVEKCNKKSALDLVVANAGIGTCDDSHEATYQTFEVNIFGVLNTSLPAIETFKKNTKAKDKTLAIVSSIAGYHGLCTCPDYSASKACMKAWGEAQRVKLKQLGINVTVICPGFVKSRITDQNTCAMPGILEIDEAAKVISEGLNKKKAIIAFPWYLRLSTWLLSILPNKLSDKIYCRLPDKA